MDENEREDAELRSAKFAAQFTALVASGWENHKAEVADLFFDWCRWDSPRALLSLARGDDLEMQNFIITRLATFQLTGNRSSAQAWAEQIADPQLRLRAIAAVQEVAAVAHPKEELDRVSRGPESEERQRQLVGWTKAVAEYLPELVWEAACDPARPDGDRSAMQLAAMVSWAASYPQLAAQHLEELPVALQKGVTEEVAGQWANGDPLEAAQWAEGLSDDSLKLIALTDVMPKLAATDPAAAIRFLEAQADFSGKDELLSRTALAWGQSDVVAAAEWLSRRPESQAKSEAIRDLVITVARNDLTAANSIIALMPEGQSLETSLASYLEMWTFQDPQTALKWASGQSTDAAGISRITKTFQLVAEREPSLAFDELSAIPPGTLRDQAIAAVVPAAVARLRDLALAWANQISDPTLRNSVRQQAASGVRRN